MASPLDALGRRSSAASRKAKQESQRLTAAGIVCDEVDGLEKGSGMAVELRRCFFFGFFTTSGPLESCAPKYFPNGAGCRMLANKSSRVKKIPNQKSVRNSWPTVWEKLVEFSFYHCYSKCSDIPQECEDCYG